MRAGSISASASALALALLLMLLAPADMAAGGECTRAEFIAVVEEASALLGALNRKNKPLFQDKLRELKAKHSWSHDEFMKNAASYVRDDKIAGFDTASQNALLKIERLGSEGENANSPDCGLLKELRRHMGALVKTQKAKWQYMFGKIDMALAK